jgi:MinD superfamily P-loop ATPase
MKIITLINQKGGTGKTSVTNDDNFYNSSLANGS